jgi:hypothetical protein
MIQAQGLDIKKSLGGSIYTYNSKLECLLMKYTSIQPNIWGLGKEYTQKVKHHKGPRLGGLHPCLRIFLSLTNVLAYRGLPQRIWVLLKIFAKVNLLQILIFCIKITKQQKTWCHSIQSVLLV